MEHGNGLTLEDVISGTPAAPAPVSVFKAQETAQQCIPDLNICGVHPLPETSPRQPGESHKAWLKRAYAQFATDGEKIEAALFESLPGGTYDHLVGLMMQRKSSQLVVRHV